MSTQFKVGSPFGWIDEGPSRMDLMLALFNRRRPDPLTFKVRCDVDAQTVKVWLTGLSFGPEHCWWFEGLITNDSPVRPNEQVVGFYNDHTRAGSFNNVLA